MSTRRNRTRRRTQTTFPARREILRTSGRTRKRRAYRRIARLGHAFTAFLIFYAVFITLAISDNHPLTVATYVYAGIWGIVGAGLYLAGSD
jgi:hypothetical protein